MVAVNEMLERKGEGITGRRQELIFITNLRINDLNCQAVITLRSYDDRIPSQERDAQLVSSSFSAVT